MSLTSRLEHFDGATKPSDFEESAGSGGSFTYGSTGYVSIDRGASSVGILLTLDEDIAIDEWASIEFAQEWTNPDFRTGFMVGDASGAVDADQTQAALEADTLIFVQHHGSGVWFRYWDDSDVEHWWNGSAWVTSEANVGVTTNPSFLILRLHVDGANERWRIELIVEQPSTETVGRGIRTHTLTDWVDWADTRAPATGEMRAAWGHFPTGAANKVTELEYVRVSVGDPYFLHGNGKDSITGPYQVYGAYALGDPDQAGGWIPCPRENANTPFIALGSGGSSDDVGIRGRSITADVWPLSPGDDLWCAYAATDGSTRRIHFASTTVAADGLPGTWTKDAGNPYWTGNFPYLIPYDGTYYLFFMSNNSGTFEIELRSTTESDPINATWTDHGVILTVSGSGWDSEHVSNPVALPPAPGRQYWVLFFSGAEAAIGPGSNIVWGTGFATTEAATDPLDPTDTWTKDGSNPLRAWDDSPATLVDGAVSASAFVTVDDTTDFNDDDPVSASGTGTNTSYILQRIRRVIDGTDVELYGQVTLPDNAAFSHSERGSPYFRDVKQLASGGWVAIGTHFRDHLGDHGSTFVNSSERAGLWLAPDFDGPWVPAGLSDEPLLCMEGSNGRAHGWENGGFIHPPGVAAIVLTPNDVSHAHALDQAAGSQVHALSASDVDHAHALDQATLTQAHLLTAVALGHAHGLDPTTIAHVHVLSADDVGQGHGLDATTISQVHVLSGAGVVHGQSLDQAGVSQVHPLTAEDVAHAHAMGAAAIALNSTFAADDLTHAHGLDAAAIAQVHALAASDVSHSHALDPAGVVQAHVLTGADVAHGHSLDQAAISLSTLILAAADLVHTHGLDAAAVSQLHDLVPEDVGHVHPLASAAVVINTALAAADVAHGHSLDAPAVALTHVLVPVDVGQGHALDAAVLGQLHALTAADVAHSHSLDAAMLPTTVLYPGADQLYTVPARTRTLDVEGRERTGST